MKKIAKRRGLEGIMSGGVILVQNKREILANLSTGKKITFEGWGPHEFIFMAPDGTTRDQNGKYRGIPKGATEFKMWERPVKPVRLFPEGKIKTTFYRPNIIKRNELGEWVVTKFANNHFIADKNKEHWRLSEKVEVLDWETIEVEI